METKATYEVCKNQPQAPCRWQIYFRENKPSHQQNPSKYHFCTKDPMTHQRFTGCDPVTALQKIQRGDLRRIAKCSYAKLQRYICKASWAGRI